MKAKGSFGCSLGVVLACLIVAGCTMVTPAASSWTDGKTVSTSSGQGFYELGLGADVSAFATHSVGGCTVAKSGSVLGTKVGSVATGDNVTHLTTITGQAAQVIPSIVTPKP